MKEVLVVGSSESFIREKLAPRLEKHGLSVVEHWDWTSKPKSRLPKKAQGIILIAPEATSQLATMARSLARDSNLPCAEVARKFSQAMPVLERVGLIVPGDGDGALDEEPTEGDIYESALTYMTAEMKSGREPTLSEVQGVLFRIYDQAVGLPRSVYKRAQATSQSRVLQQQQQQQQQQDNKTWDRDVEDEEKTPFMQAVEWALLHIEDRPEKDNSEIATLVQKDVEGISALEARGATNDARKSFLNRCKNWRKLPNKEREALDKSRQAWAERFTLLKLKQTGEMPPYSEVREEARRLFDVGISDKSIIKARKYAKSEVESQEDTVPPLPSEDIVLLTWVPRERLYSHYVEAHEFMDTLSSDVKQEIREWVYKLDDSDDTTVPGDIKWYLSLLDGNPLTFSIVLALCIGEDARVTKSTVYHAYRGLTGKGTDHRYIRAAFWAVGREFRESTEPSYLKTLRLDEPEPSDGIGDIIKAIEEDPDDTEVQEAVEAIEVPTEVSDLKAERAEFQAHNQRLQNTYDDLFRIYKAEKKEAEKTSAKLSKALEENKGLSSALDVTENKAADALNQVAALQDKLAEQQKDAKETMMSLRGKYGAATQKNKRLEQEVEGLRTKVAHLDKQHTNELGHLADQLQKAKEDRARMKDSRDKAREEAQAYKDAAEALEFRIAELEVKLEDAKIAAKKQTAPTGLTLRELVTMGYDVNLTAPKG